MAEDESSIDFAGDLFCVDSSVAWLMALARGPVWDFGALLLRLWPYEVAVASFGLYEEGETWNSLFLLLFLLMQLFDLSKFFFEGRFVEVSCAFAGTKVLGHILLPALSLSQHILQVALPPRPAALEAGDDSPPDSPCMSSYRFLSVASHMLVLVSSLQWAECGTQEGAENLQALVYAGIVVYIVSLPARVGAIFVLVLAALVLVVVEVLAAAALVLTPAVFEADGFQAAAFCCLYAAVYLCEPHFSARLDFHFCPLSHQHGETSCSHDGDGGGSDQSAAEGSAAALPAQHISPYRAYSRYPVFTKSEQLRQQQLILQQRQLQQLEQQQEQQQLQQQQQLHSPPSAQKSRCLFPVTSSSSSKSKRPV